MGISQATISKLKSLPVSEVLQKDGAALKKVGREFVTQCLWHDDRNPSLTVSDDKGFVFCHVCQHKDDGIGFVAQRHGLNFAEACERIADSNAITIEKVDEDPKEVAKNKAAKAKAYQLVTDSQIRYRKGLAAKPESVRFIQSRNILPETSREFGIGYDETQKRITIPISDHLGKYVGFTARTILPDAKPKYKNTENNLVFNKNEIVFNENKASEHIRSKDECVFVEGHLDVVSLWQAGVKNVVALQGTATPSERILKRLMRKTNRFVLCMDSDAGGIKAIGRFLNSVQDYTLKGELEVRVAVLPDGMDPDDLIQSGGSIESVISNAQSWLDWVLDQWLGTLDFTDELKIQQVEKQIKELFSKIASPALKNHYFDKASIRLAQNKQSLAAEISKGFREYQGETLQLKTWTKPGFEFTRKFVEKRLLRLYIHSPEVRWMLAPLMENLYYPQMKWLWRRLQEIQQFVGNDFCHHSVLAVLGAAEPIYMQTLRPIVKPSISIDDNEMSIAHLEEVMMKKVEDTYTDNE